MQTWIFELSSTDCGCCFAAISTVFDDRAIGESLQRRTFFVQIVIKPPLILLALMSDCNHHQSTIHQTRFNIKAINQLIYAFYRQSTAQLTSWLAHTAATLVKELASVSCCSECRIWWLTAWQAIAIDSACVFQHVNWVRMAAIKDSISDVQNHNLLLKLAQISRHGCKPISKISRAIDALQRSAHALSSSFWLQWVWSRCLPIPIIIILTSRSALHVRRQLFRCHWLQTTTDDWWQVMMSINLAAMRLSETQNLSTTRRPSASG